MKRIRKMLTSVLTPKSGLMYRFVRQHTILSVVTGGLAMSVIVGGIALAVHGDSNLTTIAATNADTTSKPANAGKGAKAAADTTKPDAPATEPSKPGTTNAAKPAAQPKASAPTGAKRLIITPGHFSVKAGEFFNGITVKTDDGKAVAMPMFMTGGQGGQVFFNFAAAPTKTVWTGNMGTGHTAKPGTYTIEVQAQFDRNTFYKGTMSYTILPTGYMSASLQQVGYNPQNDTMEFALTLTRHHGYTEAVEFVFAHDYGNTLECVSQYSGGDNYRIFCYHATGARPTSGTLSANASTPDYRGPSATTTFNLPPKQQ